MDLLSNLLTRYKRVFKDKQSEIELITKVIKEQTNITLTSKELSLREGIVFLKTKPKYKLELILKKPQILNHLDKLGLKIFDLK